MAGGAGEREIAALVTGWARDTGLEATVHERTAGRRSVVVRARGHAPSVGRTLLRLGSGSRVLLIATEGPTDPDSYARALATTRS